MDKIYVAHVKNYENMIEYVNGDDLCLIQFVEDSPHVKDRGVFMPIASCIIFFEWLGMSCSCSGVRWEPVRVGSIGTFLSELLYCYFPPFLQGLNPRSLQDLPVGQIEPIDDFERL